MSGGRSRSYSTAFFFGRSGIPPNLATTGFLSACSTLAWKHLRGPNGVAMVALKRDAIFVTVGSCLQAGVFDNEVVMTNSTRFGLWTPPASR
jgi:hypothetical protein